MSLRFPQLSREDVAASVRTILETMTETLIQRGRIEIRGFGAFYVNARPPRIGRNPRTGEKVDVPAKHAPHFKAGKELMQRVNPQAAHAVASERNAA
jgi:integration host factor subunit beta